MGSGSEAKLMARHRREQLGQQQLTSSSSEDEQEPQAQRRKRFVRKKTFPHKRGMTFALTSGVFAAFAGTFGKLAMNESETVLVCEQISHSSFFNFSTTEALMMCDKVSIYLRIVAFLTMVLLNTVMWTTFVKALRYCSTSLEATVTNTAANFFSSAVVGQLVFDESVNLMWCIGTVLIIVGLLLMNYGGTSGATAIKERRKKFKSR